MLEDIQKNFERIIALYESKKEANTKLLSKLSESETANESYRKQIIELQKQIEDLKLAEAFLMPAGSSDEAKARIGNLLKEINKCISILEK